LETENEFAEVKYEMDLLITDYLTKICSGNAFFQNQKQKLFEIMQHSFVQEKFPFFVSQIKLPRQLQYIESLDQLSELFQCFLTGLVNRST